MKRKRRFFNIHYTMIKFSRCVFWIRMLVTILFMVVNLIFKLQVIHFNIYLTLCIMLHLLENGVFAMASTKEEIFDKNKKRHLLFASMPTNLWLITLLTFWPITITLIKIPIGGLLKIIIAFVFSKFIVNVAASISNHFEMKIVDEEE